MKKVYSGLLVFLLLLIITPSKILAYAPITPSFGENIRQEIRERKENKVKTIIEKKENLREQLLERKSSREASLTEMKIRLIRSFWERLFTRLRAAVDRLEYLILRIESRLTKIESTVPQINTTDIREELTAAKEMLNSQKEKMQNLKPEIEKVLSSDDPKEAFAKIRLEIRDIKIGLIEVHRKLVHIIGKIKGLRVGQGGEVKKTFTPSVTPMLTPTPTITS